MRNVNDKIMVMPLFTNPLMQIQLDLDLEKITELAFQTCYHNPKGVQQSNKGGWQSDNLVEETHEEFIRFKKVINRHLQIYHAEIFNGMEFNENITQHIDNMWLNINEKHHYNDWHVHPGSALSGVFYIKHDGSKENGEILFKRSNGTYFSLSHWPGGLIKTLNEVTAEVINIKPRQNMLLIFPAWLEHKVEMNLKDDNRISLSFNSGPINLDKKND